MSDFEQRMLRRAEELQTQKEREAREAQERQLGKEAQAAELERRALRLGMEVVELLRKYNVPSHKIWELKPTGETTQRIGGYTLHGLPRRHTVEIKDYVYSGQGWQVYSTPWNGHYGDEPMGTRWAGIADSGKVILKPRVAVGKKLNGEEVNGILDPNYEQPWQSIGEIQSDLFQDGIANLVGGHGRFI